MKANILIVDDTPENLRLLAGILAVEGYHIRPSTNGLRAMESAQYEIPDLILLDIRMPDMDGYAVCQQLKANEHTRDIPVIFISALNEVADKVKGFEAGGVDYITKPFEAEEVLSRVEMHLKLQRYQNQLEELVNERTVDLQQEIERHKATGRRLQESLTEIQRLKDELERENVSLRQEIKTAYNFENIIGASENLNYILFRVQQVAATDTSVLITGETGTGKELIARAVHFASRRKDRPLVKVNCAALPAHLIESELFGHEKGAFTGANARQIGRFELADGATLFLDEVGELPFELQAKLLRVLQDGEFERLGNPRTITVDVRVIAATNRDLDAEIRAGRFRQDLYYRLNVYPLSLPPLRDRPEDIPLLVQAFVQKFNKKLGKQIENIPQHTMTALQKYPWPGNIRELENVIERAVIMTHDKTLRIELPTSTTHDISFDDDKTLEEMERDYIRYILDKTDWKISGDHSASAILGMHPNTLRSRMQKLGIKKP